MKVPCRVNNSLGWYLGSVSGVYTFHAVPAFHAVTRLPSKTRLTVRSGALPLAVILMPNLTTTTLYALFYTGRAASADDGA